MSQKEPDTLLNLLHSCNRTELYQRCVGSGRAAHPLAAKKELIALLLDKAVGAINPVDVWRDAQMAFILSRWEVLRPQMGGCPASTKDPKACHQCSNMQVMACLTIQQEENIEEIAEYVRCNDSRERAEGPKEPAKPVGI